MAFLHSHSGEKLFHMGVNNGGQENEVVPIWHDAGGHFNEAWQRTWSRDNRKPAVTPKSIFAFKREDKVEALVYQARKGVSGVKS